MRNEIKRVQQRARPIATSAASSGKESRVAATMDAALLSVMTAAFFTLLVQAALSFQKYRFDNGLMLGTTLAAVNWYEDVARRKNLQPSRLTLLLTAAIAAALTLILQQAAHVLAAALPFAITQS
jgi:hypothetical protein